jgi:tetratricopeptide (TPR) repeat protein
MRQKSRRVDDPVGSLSDPAVEAAARMRKGDYAGALPLLQRAAETAPPGPALLSATGLALMKLGRNHEALECYERSLSLSPDNAAALSAAGALHLDAGNHKAAEKLLRKAAKLTPRSPEHLCGLGLIKMSLGKKDEALEFFNRALDLNPCHHRSLIAKGGLEAGKGNSGEAAASLKMAITSVSSRIAFSSGNFEKAAGIRRKVAAANPGSLKALLSLADALYAAGKLEDCAAAVRDALKLEPDLPGLHVRLGQCLLAAGDFKNGWTEYEWRIKENPLSREFIAGKKRWDGRPLQKGSLLIICEEGAGDTIQMARFLPAVRERAGVPVRLACRDGLVRLLKNTWGRKISVSSLIPGSGFSCYYPLMSLPFLFEAEPGSVPSAPYIRAAKKDIDFWGGRAARLKGKKIGLSWAGNPLNRNDKWRSIKFSDLKPLFDLKNISFVSLQKHGVPSKDETSGLRNFHDWTPELKDFADSAALVSCLDLVISVDSAAAHLGGALGKPTWNLMQFVPDWRWGHRGEETMWYSSMRIIRQKKLNDWPGVIKQLASELPNI